MGMYILFETVHYIDGTSTAQLCGTYDSFEDAHRVMYGIYKDELASDDEYDEDWCEVTDTFATCRGEGGFPRVIEWFIFDSGNPEPIVY